MRESYFTEQEYTLLLLDMDTSTPLSIRHVTATQLSVARHYGGCTYQGQHYIYNHNTDELIRADVMETVEKMRKAAKKADKKPVETSLF